MLYPAPSQPATFGRAPAAGDYVAQEGAVNNAAVVTAAGRKYYQPFWVPARMAVDAIVLNCTTAVASSVIDVHRYTWVGPGSSIVLQDSSPLCSIDMSATGVRTGTFTAVTLPAGWGTWWMLRCTTGAPRFMSAQLIGNLSPVPVGNEAAVGHAYADTITGTGPAASYAVTASGFSGNSFRMALRLA